MFPIPLRVFYAVNARETIMITKPTKKKKKGTHVQQTKPDQRASKHAAESKPSSGNNRPKKQTRNVRRAPKRKQRPKRPRKDAKRKRRKKANKIVQAALAAAQQ